jgi:hypothetical protein
MFRRRILQVGALVFVIAAPVLSAQAARFSEASLKGSYSFMINKWTVDVSLNQFAMVGVLTFDGAGNVTGSGTRVSGGVSESGALGGTYTVNSNGTGVMELTTAIWTPAARRFTFVLNSTAAGVAHGFQFVQTNNGNNVVFSGSASLQSPTGVTYSLASLQGSFALQFNAWSADPGFDEQGGIGTFTFDGKGNLKGSLTLVDGGTVGTGTFTGTYAVNDDGSCSMSFVISKNGGTPNIACALTSVGPLGAEGLQALVTNPGPTGTDNSSNYAVTATGVRQSTESSSTP